MDGSRVGNDTDTREFWDSAASTRIVSIGYAPPLQQHSASSIEAFDEEEQTLMDAREIIRSRCSEEEEALNRALNAILEHRGHEEDTIARSLATIRSRRNLLAPVMRLPPEILSQIFISHAQLQKWRLEAVVMSTHVCRRWRQIGVDCPGLWSPIKCDDRHSRAWMATMIERSRSAPLSLFLVNRKTMDSQKVALIVNNMHRFGSLDLKILHNKFEAFDKPVPLLQNLKISYSGSSPLAFPPEFLSGHAPNLRHVRLYASSYIPWHSGLFANLVTLYVNGQLGWDEFGTDNVNAPSLEVLLSALVKTPRLEILRLCGCFQSSSAPSMMGYSRVDLTNLRELDMTISIRNCARFLRQVAVNATMYLKIRCARIFRADVDEFFTVFPLQIHSSSPPIAQALEFAWYDDYELNIALRSVEFTDSPIANIQLCFIRDYPPSNEMSCQDLTWACFAALVSPHLRSFCISSNDSEWDVEAWRRLGRAAPNLRRLTLGMPTQPVELCKALCLLDEQDPVPADYLPALSYLELAAPYDHPIPMPGGDATPLHEVLEQYLSTRVRIGCSTPELVFTAPREAAPDDWP